MIRQGERPFLEALLTLLQSLPDAARTLQHTNLYGACPVGSYLLVDVVRNFSDANVDDVFDASLWAVLVSSDGVRGIVPVGLLLGSHFWVWPDSEAKKQIGQKVADFETMTENYTPPGYEIYKAPLHSRWRQKWT